MNKRKGLRWQTDTKTRRLAILFGMLFPILGLAQESFSITGKILSAETGLGIEGVAVVILNSNHATFTGADGEYALHDLEAGTYTIRASQYGFGKKEETIELNNGNVKWDVQLFSPTYQMGEVQIEEAESNSFGISRLRAVEGTAIYASKKNEVVVLKDVTANLATNNSRQVYAKVAGLNIWESDGAGVQLGIGGRGLSPSRNSNFNTRQNGYDISADALGYPESYYTPPVEALKKIEIVRGAASLQYGTQFGGMLNFQFKEGPEDKKFEGIFRQTLGSFGLFNSFNSVGGSLGKVNYYAFYQYKRSKGWRPNSGLEQHTAHASVRYQLSPRLSIKAEYSLTDYLAQQAGGLTDAQYIADPRQSLRERNWFQVNWNLFSLDLDYRFSPKTQLNSRTFGLVAGRDALGNLSPITLADFDEPRDFLSDDFRNWGNETRLIHRYQLFGNPSVLLIGSRIYDGMTLRKQGFGDAGSEPHFEYLNPQKLEGSDFVLPSQNVALFAEHIFPLSPTVSITPGIRYEFIHTEADGYYRNLVRDLAGNLLVDEMIAEKKRNARDFVFGGIGLSWKPKADWELYGNFSQNYRAINFNDIRVTVGSLVVDPNLTDERGYNADLGFRGTVSDFLSFDLSLFHLAYKDRIGTVLKREPNPVFNNLVDRIIRFRTNVADADIYGIESFAELDVWQLLHPESEVSLSIFSNLALIHATYVNSGNNGVEGNQVELVPGINFKTGISFQQKAFRASWQYAYVGEHFSDATNAVRTPTAIEGIIPAYDIMDLSLSYQLGRFRFEAGLNNLMNRMYFTRRATGYPGPGILPSTGRGGYVGVQMRV